MQQKAHSGPGRHKGVTRALRGAGERYLLWRPLPDGVVVGHLALAGCAGFGGFLA